MEEHFADLDELHVGHFEVFVCLVHNEFVLKQVQQPLAWLSQRQLALVGPDEHC